MAKVKAILTEHANFFIWSLPSKSSIDTNNVLELEAELNKALSTGKHLMLDFKNLSFINSTGISTLIKVTDQHQVSGRKVVICCITHPVHLALQALGMDSFFKFYRTRKEAENALVDTNKLEEDDPKATLIKLKKQVGLLQRNLKLVVKTILELEKQL